MGTVHFLIDFIVHIDTHLKEIVANYGAWTYAILFLIVFCETGLVVTPFLPGDSLLFAAGALAANNLLNPHLLFALLLVAAIIGDAVNYAIGHYIGPKVFERKDSRFIKREYLERTHKFFLKYGGKAIVFARFVPIVRTFAPFLAGVGAMPYHKFALFNVTGGIAWVALFSYGGYFFGSLPFVEKNFKLVILGIIVVSILPALFEAWRARKEAKQSAGSALAGADLSHYRIPEDPAESN